MTVYFLKAKGKDVYKIGFTEQSVRSRLEQVQTQCPYELEIFGYLSLGGRNLEKEIHEQFAASRLNGEWFNLTKAQVVGALESHGATHRFEQTELDSGAVFELDTKNNSLYVDIHTLPLSRFELMIYASTGDTKLDIAEERIWLNVNDIIEDDPEFEQALYGMCERAWPAHKEDIWAQMDRPCPGVGHE